MWSGFERSNPDLMLKLKMPKQASEELKSLAFGLVEQGYTEQTYNLTDGDMLKLK
eukprot:CAMPEP_0198244512 /NCGR_PEP_ID=MMETSP1446-20131203/35667_1 /TAXON_ID=1461542 ORGANISM="Unidentified sp, Strain CCMP2111" /NCGR_SAMPLE_ID=MMETSP1446 /ASSEMBLY_ACC=CAM_ASM_001112 /LENGTH=54 /DNA_ID=CAMNT_0043928569 /DNA_START=1 /DNA_END=162 /DNA_ORIENTATION=+